METTGTTAMIPPFNMAITTFEPIVTGSSGTCTYYWWAIEFSPVLQDGYGYGGYGVIEGVIGEVVPNLAMPNKNSIY